MPFTGTVDVRYADLDGMNHVNHVTYVAYLEDVRLDYFEEVLGLDLEDPGLVVGEVTVKYSAPVSWDETLEIEAEIPSLDEKSFPMEYTVRREDGVVAATGETVQIAVDSDGAREIPDEWRTAIREFENLD
jgi:acyl-CoA thioester hydrolase